MKFKVLNSNRITVAPMTIDIEERSRRAREIFHSGYNCCQAVALAFSDITGLDEKTLAAASSGFGGGFGRLREVCGCVSGMTLVAGLVSPATDPSNMEARRANYALVQRLAEAFRSENGSIVCRELLGLAAGAKEGPAPSPRTPEYYKARSCEDRVASAARILATYLSETSAAGN